MAYLDLAKLGKNHWWRYVLGVLLIVLMWQGVGLLPTVALAIWVGLDQNDTTLFNTETLLFEGLPMEVIFADFMGMFLFLWLGVFLVVRFLHDRPFWSLFTPLQRLNWRRVLQGALVFAAIYLAVGVIMEWLFPTPAEDIEYVLQPSKFLAFLPLALLLIPIQTSAEELLFRGYFMQGLGLIMNRWGVALVSSVLFALPHLLNPEVLDANLWIAFLPYWIIGLLLALITLRDGTLELALGVHASNNLMAFLLVTVPPYDMFPSVFVYHGELFTWATVVNGAVVAVLFYWVIFRFFARPTPITEVY
jgi:Cation transport ATPase